MDEQKARHPIKAAVLESGMKQGFIARKIKVDAGAMTLIVHGKRFPDSALRVALAKVLGRKQQELWPELYQR
ncbi:MAG: helix-turn-helix transcriptional regulator [Desulfobulbaceae bacterium]|jgi:plasmid maintenance system antidote protein VapI|nr:helix-turn-helix transcriptional regulator [Desulfobulbaceae bacterium]